MGVKPKHIKVQKAYWTKNGPKAKEVNRLLSDGNYILEDIQKGILTDTYIFKTYRGARVRKNNLKFMLYDLLLGARERRLTKQIVRAKNKEAFNCC
mgnify:CR=1 FL=1